MQFILLVSCFLFCIPVLADPVDILTNAKKEYALYHFSKAISLLLPLAKHGNIEAQTILGWAYEDSYDYFQAEYWFRQAAQNNYPTAQIELAQLLKNHGFNGGVLDLLRSQESEYWLLNAAKHGCDSAVYDLMRHFNSDPDYADMVEAQKWYFLLTPSSRKMVDLANPGEIVLSKSQEATIVKEVEEWRNNKPASKCKKLINPKYNAD